LVKSYVLRVPKQIHVQEVNHVYRTLSFILLLLLLVTPAVAQRPPIRHVFTIILENKSFNETFGPNSPAPYLSQQLTAQGELLTNYYGIGHNSLPNYIALVSGQAPNLTTQGDCQIYQDFVPNSSVQVQVNGQTAGQGCVFPAETQTVADQLQSHQFTWRGYMEDMPAPCTHPALNTQDQTQTAKPGDQYAARHNPFVYFHSIIDGPSCAANDVPLTQLSNDLMHLATTPNYVFITPNLCHDGHDSPCVDGEPGGLVSADAFLREWVPQILASPAYQRDGMLLILFDEAELSGSNADATACCNEIPGPNSPLPGIVGPGGGRVGAVVLSKYVRPGTVVTTPYNHYSLLRTIEDLFGLDHLGFAGQAGANSFGLDVFIAVP
jgi:phosphatidylinositol-3-phosphatase